MIEQDSSKNEPAVDELIETPWTDDAIRWPDDPPKKVQSDDDDDEEETGFMDPFKDPDPFQIFSFHFQNPFEKDGTLDITVRGYKSEADEIWQSTGLTLWRASEFLCEFQLENAQMFQGKRVLELGAGLGLNGILLWNMGICSTVCITDGDTQALVHIRENIKMNHHENDENSISSLCSCHQLIWGKETSGRFLKHIAGGKSFDVIIASDIIYAECIIQPLWETVKTLISRPDGVFVMAFARRRVPISIDFVLESATKNGFEYDMVREDKEEGIWVYKFHFRQFVEKSIE